MRRDIWVAVLCIGGLSCGGPSAVVDQSSDDWGGVEGPAAIDLSKVEIGTRGRERGYLLAEHPGAVVGFGKVTILNHSNQTQVSTRVKCAGTFGISQWVPSGSNGDDLQISFSGPGQTRTARFTYSEAASGRTLAQLGVELR